MCEFIVGGMEVLDRLELLTELSEGDPCTGMRLEDALQEREKFIGYT